MAGNKDCAPATVSRHESLATARSQMAGFRQEWDVFRRVASRTPSVQIGDPLNVTDLRPSPRCG